MPFNSSQNYTWTFNAGEAVGDFAVFMGYATQNQGPAGWTRYTDVSGTLTLQVFTKVLNSTDIALGFGFGFCTAGSLAAGLIYRGAASATVRGTAAGFAKSSRCVGIISLVEEGTPNGTGLTAPAAMTSRIAPFGTGSGGAAAADIAPRSYVNGTPLAYGGKGAGVTEQVIELMA